MSILIKSRNGTMSYIVAKNIKGKVFYWNGDEFHSDRKRAFIFTQREVARRVAQRRGGYCIKSSTQIL